MPVGIVMLGAQFDEKERMCKVISGSTIAALIRCFPEVTEILMFHMYFDLYERCGCFSPIPSKRKILKETCIGISFRIFSQLIVGLKQRQNFAVASM